MTKPRVGEIYVTTKISTDGFWENPAVGTRYLVEDIFVEDIEQSDDFFLVTVVNEADKGDMSAASQELDSQEWLDFMDRYGLKLTS